VGADLTPPRHGAARPRDNWRGPRSGAAAVYARPSRGGTRSGGGRLAGRRRPARPDRTRRRRPTAEPKGRTALSQRLTDWERRQVWMNLRLTARRPSVYPQRRTGWQRGISLRCGQRARLLIMLLFPHHHDSRRRIINRSISRLRRVRFRKFVVI